jgi:hypothetical protein
MAKQPKKAFSFAHLLSRAGIRADGDQDGNEQDQDDERKQRDDESDEDYAKRMEELDKKGGDDDQDGAGADDGDDPDADDGDESDKEKAARARERARCAAIFGSKAAASRPDVAAHLAFNTSMSATEAIGMLGAFAAGGAPAASAKPGKSLASRMAKVPDQNVGTGGAAAPSGPQGAAAMIISAGKKRRGEA